MLHVVMMLMLPMLLMLLIRMIVMTMEVLATRAGLQMRVRTRLQCVSSLALSAACWCRVGAGQVACWYRVHLGKAPDAAAVKVHQVAPATRAQHPTEPQVNVGEALRVKWPMMSLH